MRFRTVRRHAGLALIGPLALLGGCASFEFSAGGENKLNASVSSSSAVPNTAVIGATGTRVPAGETATLLSNRSGSTLRLLVTMSDDAEIELSAAPLAGSPVNCSGSGRTTLALRGQSVLLRLDNGCALQAVSRASVMALLRVQIEAPTFPL